jgi:hydroxymethylbilane synthase
MKTPDCIRIGTRGSKLAHWQAEWIAQQIREQNIDVELVTITTQGDQNVSGSVGALGSTGVFTKEIQRALLENQIDLAVHSLKDLPTEPVDGIFLIAVPKRVACMDVLLSQNNYTLHQLPSESRIGTGSIRRQSQVLFLRNDVRVLDIRGNVETRIGKLKNGDYDAIVLARAGLERLGLEQHISYEFAIDEMLPAVGQGALGLETRCDDERVQQCVRSLDHPPSHQAVLAERALLAHLRGGCLAPVGAWGRVDDEGHLQLDAVVLDAVGTKRLTSSQQGSAQSAIAVGEKAAKELLKQGAASLIDTARDTESQNDN